nr:MAG TPA: GRB2-binding adapter (GAPT) [Caudoviricetes sp.]
MLFCACSSVTIAIGIINAYMLVLCLYSCPTSIMCR